MITVSSTKVFYGIAIGLAVTIVSGFTCWYHHWKKKQNTIPKKWRRVGILEQINLFPIKSCSALNISTDTEVECEILGLRLDNIWDRALMIIDQNNEMITGRVYPTLVLIRFKKLGNSQLQISAPDMENIDLDFETLPEFSEENTIHTAVWSTKLKAMHCGVKYDKWFSQFILKKDSGLRLVYYPYSEPVRSINPRMKDEPYITPQDTGTFNDATSYMMMNLASITDLNTHITKLSYGPVYPMQFRGNFHLKMDIDEPYAEDRWSWVKIGDNTIFRVIAPCTRCIFPNINPYTGERSPNSEPQKTLQKYRKWPKYSTPVLGVHLGLRKKGAVKANDIVYVEDNS